jgi:nucleoside-diphosphate-sugar epimerase
VRVLVTGSRGFVGGHLMDALGDRNIDVLGYDKKSYGDLNWDWVVDACIKFDPTVIVHLASSCSTLGSIRDPGQTFRDTVSTTFSICEVARTLQVPLLLTSSVKARDGQTPYGAAKQMSETWASECCRTYDFPLIINRPGTIYGPGQEGSTESGWIAWFLKAKRENIEVTINGDGLQVRDLLHVKDYVNLLLAQLTNPDLYIGKTWDVGGGSDNVVTVVEIADYLGLSYVYGPSRYGDARGYVGLNDVPGWEPRIFWKESETFV